MGKPRLAGLNLNSLVALDALLTERNVTRAAQRVGISQPAMSQTLARLRALFDDPLLVRRGRNLTLTPRAHSMLVPLSNALLSVERAVQLGMGFEPETSTRVFRIALADLSVTMVFPRLLQAVAARAPGVRLQAQPLSIPRLADRLASGQTDLAVSFYLAAADGLEREMIAADGYVCLVREGHPLVERGRVELHDYATYDHLAYTPVGFVPRQMAEAAPIVGSTPGIRASVPYLLTLPHMVRSTDLVATVPARILDAPIDLDGIVSVEAPPGLPELEHSQWWHQRYDADPGHRWLRELVREAFDEE